MTQSKAKVNLNDLRKIIKQELRSFNESVDHNGIKEVVTGASKLLAAIESFKDSAPDAAINAVTPHLTALEGVLEDMVNTPGSYVTKAKIEPKVVSLKAVK